MGPSALIIGGTGLIGSAVFREFRKSGFPLAPPTAHSHMAEGFIHLDLRDVNAVGKIIERHSPLLVILAAACPHVDYCEQNPSLTRQINVEGTNAVARICRELKAKLVFFSSDYVFDGETGVYDENEPVCPINEYGRQKVEAERLVMESSANNLILRTSGAFGWEIEPKNFVLQILAKLMRGTPIRATSDVSYNPTYADNIAEALMALVAVDARGIFHVAGDTLLTRYEFALHVARVFGLKSDLIMPISSSDLVSVAPRPRQSSLSTNKIRETIKTRLMTVDEALNLMLAARPLWQDDFVKAR